MAGLRESQLTSMDGFIGEDVGKITLADYSRRLGLHQDSGVGIRYSSSGTSAPVYMGVLRR